MKKRILAGILAAVLALTVSAGVLAAPKKVSYSVTVSTSTTIFPDDGLFIPQGFWPGDGY